MKKMSGTCFALISAAAIFAALSFPMEARGDVLIEEFWNTYYSVDYDVIVDAPDGGVNLRYGAGTEYEKVIDGMIPNGTVLHIEGEARADNGKFWGQTEYLEDFGWVALSQTRKVDGTQETSAQTTEAPKGPTVPAETAAAETSAAETAAAETTAAAEPAQGINAVFSLIWKFIGSLMGS